jgi:hypothetical protein
MTDVPTPERCESCSADTVELFGYRSPDGWRCLCAEHGLGRWYAGARRWSPAAVVEIDEEII